MDFVPTETFPFFLHETSEENTDSLSVEKILINGHVPPRPAKYVERKETIQKIRDALYELKGKDEG